MSIDKHFNHTYITFGSNEIPIAVGDLYSTQDLGRDYNYLLDRLGLIAKDLYGQIPLVVLGGGVSQGIGLTLNIVAGTGYAKFQIELPDDFGAQVPPAVLLADIDAIRINWPDRTNVGSGSDKVTTYSTVDDNSTLNYVKLRYTDATLNTRVRLKKTGSYAYEVTPDYEIVVDSIVPTDYDLTLAQFTSDGATYTLTSYFDHRQSITNFSRIQFEWTSPVQLGSSFSPGTLTNTAITALNSTDIAFIDATLDVLRTYRWNGSTFIQLATISYACSSPSCTAINATDIAIVDGSADELETYRFTGSSWIKLGNTLSISGINVPRLASLNSTDIVLTDGGLDVLRTYRWDGTDWSLLGNSLSLGTVGGFPTITVLDSVTIAYYESNGNELKTYRWDGTDWSQIGNSLSITGQISIIALNSTDISLLNETDQKLWVYRWNGADWTQVGGYLVLSATAGAGKQCTSLNGTDIVYADDNSDNLYVYRFYFSSLGNPHGRGDLLE